MGKISLHWPVDKSGYSIEPQHRVWSKAELRPLPRSIAQLERRSVQYQREYARYQGSQTILGAVGPGPSIVCNGGSVNFYDPMEVPALYERLAGSKPTEAGVLAFVSKFGFLRGSKSESVKSICDEIKVLRGLIAAKESHDWKSLQSWMIGNSKVTRLHPKFEQSKDGKPPQLFFAPSTLRDAIYLQFFQDISTSSNLRLCKRPGCGEWFTFGPGTGRRETAEYCSPKCQKAHAYDKSKSRGKRR